VWHGSTVRLHPGTMCRLSAPGRDFDDEPCTVSKFDKAKAKWHIKLQHDRWRGKELMVPESSLRLSFCLNPDAVHQCKQLAALSFEDAQGSCGRGLVTAEPVAPATPLFEEPPLILTPMTGSRGHEDRWRAFLTLMLRRSAGGALADAFDAFQDLGICDRSNDGVEAASNAILEQALRASGGADMPEAQRREQAASVRNALMRFLSNQFKYDNYFVDEPGGRFAAAAVFRFTSRLNHS
jgi:hypothetical protein